MDQKFRRLNVFWSRLKHSSHACIWQSNLGTVPLTFTSGRKLGIYNAPQIDFTKQCISYDAFKGLGVLYRKKLWCVIHLRCIETTCKIGWVGKILCIKFNEIVSSFCKIRQIGIPVHIIRRMCLKTDGRIRQKFKASGKPFWKIKFHYWIFLGMFRWHNAPLSNYVIGITQPSNYIEQYVLWSRAVSRKSGALIVRYIDRKRTCISLVFYCF